MTEEIKNQEPATEETKTEGTTLSASDIRKHEFFQKVVGEKQSEIDKIKADFLALKADIANKEEEARKKKHEEAGNYQVLIEEEKAKREQAEQQYKTAILKRDLRDKLRDSGVTSSVFLEWAEMKFQGGEDDLDKFVSTLKEDPQHESIFNPQSAANLPAGAKPPAGASPGTRTSNASLKERLSSDDPNVKLEALKEKFKAQATGQMPLE